MRKQIFIILLIVMNIASGIVIIYQKKRCTESINKKTISNRINEESLNDITKSFSIQLNSIGNKVLEDLFLIDTSLVQHKIVKILSNGHKLCFRFYSRNCNVCIDNQLLKLNELSKKIGGQNIIVICDYDKDELFWLFQKIKPKFKCFRLRHDQDFIGLNIEKDKIPYYFICNNKLDPLFIFQIVGNTVNYVDSFFESTANSICFLN